MSAKKTKTAQDITYASYLRLDDILSAQKPVSRAHDEMMFIIVHQTYELNFKLMLLELDRVQTLLAKKTVSEHDLRVIVSGLERMVTVLGQLMGQLNVMETMTPLDFLDFRHVFGSASGFQSLQFRALEIRLGLQNDARVTYQGKSYASFLPVSEQRKIASYEKGGVLFDQLDRWLARTPFLDADGYNFWRSYRQAVKKMLDGDRSSIKSDKRLTADARGAELAKIDGIQAQFDGLFDKEPNDHWRLSRKALQAALFITLYRDEAALQTPFRLLQLVMELDALLAQWRHRHALMAQRMLGMKMGSGGSSGHDYLAATSAKHRIFRDLFGLSTFLIPRSKLPKLPAKLARKLALAYWQG